MGAKYLLRFDDICPTMRWSVWNAVETLLSCYQARPLLAVVPDNQDPALMVEAPRSDFWEWVRQKQGSHWSVGLHGYQHRFETSNAGLLGIHPRSEFSGLSASVQEHKLRQGVAIFEANGVRVDAFVAPAHSFDAATLEALRRVGICVISDGFFVRPCLYHELLWVPQQIWQFYRMPIGVWTICCHPNSWSSYDVAQLERFLKRAQTQLISFEEAVRLAQQTPARPSDLAFSQLWARMLRGRLRAKRLFRRLKGA